MWKTMALVGYSSALRVQFSHFSTSLLKCGVSKFAGENAVVMTKERAQDLVYRLEPEERNMLLHELKAQIDISLPNETTASPTGAQLRMVALHNALPFVGFGFLDNFIMIVAGDYIEASIGITFGISTMAAAGLGNAVSDVCGIGSAWYVERIASRVGVRNPDLTPTQMMLSSTRWSANLGRAVGVFVGCIVGMIPLLFTSKKSKSKDDDTTKETKKTS